ncbi:proton-coupled amino acid transporter-like protein acs [Lycorma delicatula]|uniref:proton-coupled amino acid transporter-like protein acs n=1 Tax=Lycorma delicatula TaxID=130591 RepID=UPI003F51541C
MARVDDHETGSSLQYEPSEHRRIRYPTNYIETLFHLLKASIGTGILTMPNGFAKAGYVVGFISTLLLGAICIYCIRRLVLVQYELCKRRKVPSMAYQEVAHFAILEGPQCLRGFRYMRPISNIFLVVFQVGICCIYLLFVSKNVKQVVEYNTSFRSEIRSYILIAALPTLIASLINSLKVLAIFSFIANLTTFIGFGIIMYYVFNDRPDFSTLSKFGDPKKYPLFVGTVVFSLEAIAVVMPLENEMKDPLQFTSLCGVLNVAMIPTVVLYALVGLFGYMKYGDDVAGTITLSLPDDETLSQVCKLLLTFAIYVTYSLALFVAYDIIWKAWFEKENLEENLEENSKWVTFIWQYITRVLLTTISLLLAVIIPNIELFISLVGSLCLSFSGIAFPALFDLCTYWNKYTGKTFILFSMKCFSIMILGIIMCIIGVTTSIQEIYVNEYS